MNDAKYIGLDVHRATISVHFGRSIHLPATCVQQIENDSGLEHQIASHDMGVKPIFPVAVFLDRISYPAFGIAKLSAANVSELHGEIHVGIVFQTSHLDGQIASSELKVLVARNVLYRKVAAVHTRI